MPKIVEVPELGEIEFPDDLSETDISGFIEKELSGRKQAAPIELERPDMTPDEKFATQAAQDFMLRKALNERPGLELPTGGVETAYGGKLTAGAANTAAGVIDFATDPYEKAGETATAPENQPRLDAIYKRMFELRGTRTDAGSREQAALNEEAKALTRASRESTLAGKLSRTAANATADAERVPGVAGSIARGAGAVSAFAPALALGPGGLTGIGLAGTQASAEAESAGRTQKADTMREAGVKDEAHIEIASKAAGIDSASHAALAMPAYLLAGKVGADVAARIMAGASKTAKVAAQTIAAATVNVGAGAGIRALSGEEAAPNVEQATMDVLWGLVHGKSTYASETAKAKARSELASRGWAQHEIDNPAGIPERFQQGKETPASEAMTAPEKVEGFVPEGEMPPRPGATIEQPPPVTGRTETPLKPSTKGIVPAIRAGNEIIRGKQGDEHKDILKRLSETDVEKFLLAQETFGKDNFFVDENGRERSRDQLQSDFGVNDSQRLRELQQQEQSRSEAPVASSPEVDPIAPQLRGAVDPAPVKSFIESAPTPAEAQRRTALAKDLDSPIFRTEPLPNVEPPPGPNALRPLNKSQAGGIFGGRNRVPTTKPVGAPPSGDKNWLKIESGWKRLGSGLEREGASLVLRTRQSNPLGQRLGRATDQQFDVKDNLLGKYGSQMDRAIPKDKAASNAAFDEWSRYIREKENGRPVPRLSPEAQKLHDAFGEVAEHSGLLFNSKGGKVSSPDGYRPMHLMGKDFIPRAFDPVLMKTIRNPEKYAAKFNNYVAELAAHQGIPTADAAAFLNDMAGGKNSVSSRDFMGNIELARGARLPESFYDYDMRRVVSNYINGYADRMGQIIAYGQRLEGGGRVIQKNLWDLARDEVRGGDDVTTNWLADAEKQSNNELSKGAIAVAGRRLQALATGLLLANPTSTVPRNLLSGLVSTAELLGTRRTIRAANAAMISSHGKMGAKEAGVVREDMAALLHAEQVTGDSAVDNATRWLSKTMLKISGYDASERFVRTTNFVAGSSFAHDFAIAAKKNPNSRMARQMAGLIKRMGVDPNEIIAENGDWKTGEQTRKFLRTVVARQQGGYTFNQVPLWAGTPQGRFFYQFGRWGTQKVQNVVENVLKPAFLGTETTINGVKMSVRDFKPLVRFAAGMVLAGEAFALIAQGVFGRDRKDDSLTEIASAFGRGEMGEAFKMLGGRALNDIIMSGSLGIWGTPVESMVSIKDQTRLKNPAEPPGGAGLRAAADLVMSGIQQHTITGDDTKQFLRSFVPGIVGVADATRNLSEHLPESEVTKKMQDWIEAPKYEAENDQRTLRNATERWAKAIGKDTQGGGGSGRKSPNTPAYRGIRDALLIGDISEAKQLRATFLRQFTGSKKQQAQRNLSESIRGQQPFRAGNYTSEQNQKDFYRWAKRNLSKGDLEQVVRVQARYERAAKAAGMWKSDD